jgi:hypothetical protein
MTAAPDDSGCHAVRVFTLGGRIYPGRLLRPIEPELGDVSVSVGRSVYSPADSIAGDPIIGVLPTDYEKNELVDLFNEAVSLRRR